VGNISNEVGTRTATIWTGSNYSTRRTLPYPGTPPLGALALGVNQNGSVVVGSSQTTDPGRTEATIWTDAQPQLLIQVLANSGADVSGWLLIHARAVSDDGKVVVGDGLLDGVERAFIARLP
jgi:uncharacterized membrane protein